MKYPIIIQWSEADQCYVVSLPEWGEYYLIAGETELKATSKTRVYSGDGH